MVCKPGELIKSIGQGVHRREAAEVGAGEGSEEVPVESVNLNGGVGADGFIFPALVAFVVFGGGFLVEVLFDLDAGKNDRLGEGVGKFRFFPDEVPEAFAGTVPRTSVDVDGDGSLRFFGEGGSFDEVE